MNKNVLVHNVHGVGEDTFVTVGHKAPASVLCVGAVCWLSVVGQHIVVHVDGGAVVDGVTEALSEDGLARVWGEAKQKEAGLSRRETVDRLRGTKGVK